MASHMIIAVPRAFCNISQSIRIEAKVLTENSNGFVSKKFEESNSVSARSIPGAAMDIDGDEVENGRTTKRQKLTNGSSRSQRKPGSSRLFAPYRTVGLVSPTSLPFTTVPLGKTTFQITTSVGRSLQTYDLRKGLNLVFITRPQTPETITASAALKDKVLAAWGGGDAGQKYWGLGVQERQKGG